MKKVLTIIFAALLLSSTEMSAQLGFDFGMNFEFINRKAPAGFRSSGFGMGPYAGIIYGIPVSISNMVNIGLNYKYDIIYGAMGAWDDADKLDPYTLLNLDTDITSRFRSHSVMAVISLISAPDPCWITVCPRRYPATPPPGRSRTGTAGKKR